MTDVLIALTPAAAMAAYYYGIRAITLMVVSVASAVLFEMLFRLTMKRPLAVSDFSAAVTGLLLAFNLPASAPFWLPVVGSFFAIVIVKQLFGGIGQNFVNPALCARAFLLAAYPAQMTDWSVLPFTFNATDAVSAATSSAVSAVDAVSAATPLTVMKAAAFFPEQKDFIGALIGNTGGCIGEGCAVALFAGGLYLIIRRVISWRIPFTYIFTFIIVALLFGRHGAGGPGANPFSLPLYEVITGGMLLGAFFMATDYTTSPVTPAGQIVMGAGCGILTAIIRFRGGYPEGVSYSILLMNLSVPLIERITKPRVYGVGKGGSGN